MTEHGVECERESETQDGANEERREDGLLLPLDLESGTREEVGRDRNERDETCNETDGKL